jgi:GTPase SAR1 family protein
VLDFLLKLERYFRATKQTERLLSVMPAIGALHSQSFMNLVVAGPTQSGKSTITNLLLGADIAKVSPLAGFTTCPQGFSNSPVPTETYYKITPPCDETSTERWINCYTLREVTFANRFAEGTIIWDTPDFDSVHAPGYKLPLMELLGMATVMVVVLSKEKYADEEAWKFLDTAARLKTPLIIVLNKVRQTDREAILAAFEQHLGQVEHRPVIHHITTLDRIEDRRQNTHGVVRQIQGALTDLPTPDVFSYVKSYWSDWKLPLERERKLREQWQTMIDGAYQRIVDAYQQDYQNNPYHNESFRVALEKCLQLIEVPGLETIGKIRNIISVPAKLIMKAIGSVGQKHHHHGAQETDVLKTRMENAWIKLENQILTHKEEHPEGWGCILGQVRPLRETKLTQLDEHIRSYQQAFMPEIEKTANRLYHKLQENPSLLSSLRVARVSMDALAVIISLKTAGVGLHDLLLTPAMLSVSAKLTEGALGAYMKTQAKALAETQRQLLIDKVLTPHFVEPLRAIACDSLASDIRDADIRAFEEALRGG